MKWWVLASFENISAIITDYCNAFLETEPKGVEFLGLMNMLCPDANSLSTSMNYLTAIGPCTCYRESFEFLSSHEARAECLKLNLHIRAMEAYRPPSIGIPVHLFVAGERPPGSPLPTVSLGGNVARICSTRRSSREAINQ